MSFFVCARCERRLTAEINLEDAPPSAGHDLPGKARMAAGTYTSSWNNGFVLHPDDVTGAERHPNPRRLNGCCGLDGLDGPNLVCSGCGAEIGTEESDCWKPHFVVTLPDAANLIADHQSDESAH
ncbi:hypothetical protein FHR32_005580 [Streptosporangium album]|uniref:Uncharacterized protein n=1 Tax=Streptosporangium album TaxID=47479 RepID=A0A7W7WBW1_9ACTN|nr:hypothetical protein [Streptosporangium album]MBB4941203.1 hypothetical protein [Streptosporangium album]